jgi:hypothetical protein
VPSFFRIGWLRQRFYVAKWTPARASHPNAACRLYKFVAFDWSQQQLADKAIVSLNAVARLEKGIVDSRISTVQAVQKALAWISTERNLANAGKG